MSKVQECNSWIHSFAGHIGTLLLPGIGEFSNFKTPDDYFYSLTGGVQGCMRSEWVKMG